MVERLPQDEADTTADAEAEAVLTGHDSSLQVPGGCLTSGLVASLSPDWVEGTEGGKHGSMRGDLVGPHSLESTFLSR